MSSYSILRGSSVIVVILKPRQYMFAGQISYSCETHRIFVCLVVESIIAGSGTYVLITRRFGKKMPFSGVVKFFGVDHF